MSNLSDALSFEDLSSAYRIEKKTATLSAIRKDLYPAMAALLISLRLEYEKQLSLDSESLFCEGANQRRKRANDLSREITEIRMAKICSLALLGARGGQNVLDNLTLEEKEYYNSILDYSRRHVNIVERLSGKKKFETPPIDPEPVSKGDVIVDKTPPRKIEPEVPAEMPPYIPDDEYDMEEPEPMREEDIPAPITDVEEDMMVIRILEDLPAFSGPDRNYELTKEDIVRMPKIMAEALINREKAVLLNPAP
jgi:Uncharacterized protein conserved in archaea